MVQWMLLTVVFGQATASDVVASNGSCSVTGGVESAGSQSLLQTGRGQGSTASEEGANHSNFNTLDSGDYSSSYHETPWQEGGSGRIVYLDRQNIKCSGAIQGFKLQRSHDDKLRYVVKCSNENSWINGNTVETKKTKSKILRSGYGEGYLVDYWDMFNLEGVENHVKCSDGFALQEFQLKTWHAKEQTFTDIVWENLRNVYDIIDILDPKDENEGLSLMWYDYKCVQINTQNFPSHQVWWATPPNDRCFNCKDFRYGYNGFYLDRHGIFAPNNGLLTEFWSKSVDTHNFNFEFKFAQKTSR
jgi:hypothetical protein